MRATVYGGFVCEFRVGRASEMLRASFVMRCRVFTSAEYFMCTETLKKKEAGVCTKSCGIAGN